MRREARVIETGARFSADRVYRYTLWRRWAEGPAWAFLMLNPSTADELKNDPTVERCERRARAAGAGALWVINLFAYRATDPRYLRMAADPVGPENDAAILEVCRLADVVICAWGVHGAIGGRDRAVVRLLAGAGVALRCIGPTTKHGAPRHPLYLPYTAGYRVFEASAL